MTANITVNEPGPVDVSHSPFAQLRTLPLGAVRFTSGFWTSFQAVNHAVSLKHGYRMLEKAGNLHNLRVAAGLEQGSFRGRNFYDEDVWKWLEALAWELARYGITVNIASPGWIVPHSPDHTGKGSFWKQWGYDFFTPDKLKRAMRNWPIQRLGRPEDMADTVLFLASDRASFLTGQTISVSGGAIMW
jgi:hypothetical protein